MNNLFLILLTFLPFSGLLFKKVDLWHGQGHFFQLGILFIFSASLFYKPNPILVKNKPLGIFFLWAGLVTGTIWMTVMEKQSSYTPTVLFPFINLLTFVLFYKLSIEYLNIEKIEKILKFMSYAVILSIIYCFLQVIGLDQFFNTVYEPTKRGSDFTVGFVGNQTHLAGYLAMVQPLFFRKKFSWLNLIALILLWVVILLTKSASGFTFGLLILFLWFLLIKKYKYILFIFIACIIGGYIFRKNIPFFFSDAGRIEYWKFIWNRFVQKPITGQGLGVVGLWNIKLNPSWSSWKHAHLEFYQVAIELGLVGLGLVLWCIGNYFKTCWSIRDDLRIRLGLMFLGFCLLSLTGFPCHIWILASIGMVSYSWIYVIKNEELNQCATV